jgi:hypothetical protein
MGIDSSTRTKPGEIKVQGEIPNLRDCCKLSFKVFLTATIHMQTNNSLNWGKIEVE